MKKNNNKEILVYADWEGLDTPQLDRNTVFFIFKRKGNFFF